MANDLTPTDPKPAAFSAQFLTPSMRSVLDRAFEPDAIFTAAEIALIEPIAGAVALIQVADERTIRQSLGALAAALPAQDVGEAGNKLKLNTYLAMLAGCDQRALASACRRCLDELDWMPSIHQLKERMRHWCSTEAFAISRARAIIRTGRRVVDDADPAPLPDEERERVNQFLRTRGIATQFNEDGSTFQRPIDDLAEATPA